MYQLSHNLTISEGKQWERSQYNAIVWTLCADKLHHQGIPPPQKEKQIIMKNTRRPIVKDKSTLQTDTVVQTLNSLISTGNYLISCRHF